MATTPPPLAAKFQRKIHRALRDLARDNSFLRPTIEDFDMSLIGRELTFANGVSMYLSDAGLSHVRTIRDAFFDSKAFTDRVDAEDIWQAIWTALRASFAQDQMPDTAAEMIQLVADELLPSIQTRMFLLPFFGIRFEEISDLPLGELRVIEPDPAYFEAQGLDPGEELTRFVDHHTGLLWITGTKTGSPSVAQREFRTAADLTSGLLAVVAATIFPEGASRVRIGAGQQGGPGRNSETWFTWGEAPDSLSVATGGGFRPAVPIGSVLRQQIIATPVIQRALSIIHSTERSDLEESIARGLHWFSDAHRDPVLVMQLVKYWSCIEVFFSGDGKQIVRSVSTGVASVLVLGGIAGVPPTEYLATKQRVAKLYQKRSQAVHMASREQVSLRDIEDLSRWAAWLLINILNMVEQGYSDRRSVKEMTMRFDATASAGTGSSTPDTPSTPSIAERG